MGGRWRTLVLQAHQQGVLNFSSARRYDYKWLIKEELVLDTVEDQLATELNKLAYMWHCSAAQLTEWDEKEEKFEFHRAEAGRTFRLIGKAWLPWYKRWGREEGHTLAEMWKKMKAEEQQPGFKEWREKHKAALRERVVDVETEAKASAEIRAKKEAIEKSRIESRRRRMSRAGLRR